MRKVMVFLLLLAVMVSCAPREAPAPAPAAAPAIPQAAVPAPQREVAAKPAWETEWEKALEAAKKEGKLIIYTAVGPAGRRALYQGFRERYGISAEYMAGRTAETFPKLAAERAAGIFLADLYMGGSTMVWTDMKPRGFVESLEPLLLLPEVVDPKVWRQGGIPWSDKDRSTFHFADYASGQLLINTQLVKPEELKSYRDMLHPKWKGKIAWNDPSVSGSGARWFSVMGSAVLGWDFMRELAQQEPIITRDQRLLVEWVAKGKYPIAIGAREDDVMYFVRAGAPLTYATPAEGGYRVSGSGVITLISRRPHPNATKVFVNWLLSKEGQTIYMTGAGVPSGRVDIPLEGFDFNPAVLIQPNVKYFYTESEEFQLAEGKLRERAREFFGPK